MKNLNAAPGPYEVVTIIDEEGKARGRNGEKWLLIRNADGAIASVYPGQDAEGTAALLSASWRLLGACKVVTNFLDGLEGLPEDDPLLAIRRRIHMPMRIALESAMAMAEGNQLSSVPTPPSAPDSGEANTKSVFPDKPLEDTLL